MRVLEKAVEGIWPLDRAIEIPTRYLKTSCFAATVPKRGRCATSARLADICSSDTQKI